MTSEFSEQILFVDDEPLLLEAMRRQFRRQFSVALAGSGSEALDLMQEDGPFAVVVSDRQMPGMDGVEFLGEVRRTSPDTVRIMLTGNADLNATIEAVNRGQIFRFLTKPASREDLRVAIEAGIEQYRLLTSQRVLLTQTLKGSIKVLMDMLSLLSPTAFGQAERLKLIVKSIVNEMDAAPTWEIEIAAMLSLIGCVTVPPGIVQKMQNGRVIDPSEEEIYRQHPRAGHDLIANIPRLEGVANIVLYQGKNYDGTGYPDDSRCGQEIPLGARIIRAAADYILWQCRGFSRDGAIGRLNNTTRYDPNVISALDRVVRREHAATDERPTCTVPLSELAPGMTITEDILTMDGSVLLVRQGQELTSVLLQRVRNFNRQTPVMDVVSVLADPIPVH